MISKMEMLLMKLSFSGCHVLCEGHMRCYGRGKDECFNFHNTSECLKGNQKDNSNFKDGKSFTIK